MDSLRRSFVYLCLLAFVGQPLAVVAAKNCPEQDSKTHFSTLDHSQHQSMQDHGQHGGMTMVDMAADSPLKECCKTDCGDCNLYQPPILLLTDSCFNLADSSRLKLSLSPDNLLSGDLPSPFKPPIFR